ncbi:hypothetical protein PISMIDRAFT_671308 [Pisolithus microcarpus 441]|uniref:Uncharacterized protein n=1 Tax=Pisolithus microcarpus 441 TaxID=765257 RepID=A0A0C9ZL92_9AGAM|nr:hypothetical protein PISMIDRAFT_671308 [Pisolithus microcarpus 441]
MVLKKRSHPWDPSSTASDMASEARVHPSPAIRGTGSVLRASVLVHSVDARVWSGTYLCI